MRFKLATKFSWAILGIVAISILSSGMTLYAAWRVHRRLEEMTRDSLPNIRAEDVKVLMRQRNAFVGAFLLDPANIAWEEKFHELGPLFGEWLANVRKTTYAAGDEESLLAKLDQTWSELGRRQEEVISLVEKHEDAKGKSLFRDEVAGALAAKVDSLCDQLIAANDRYVRQLVGRAQSRIGTTIWLVGISGTLSLLLGGFLLWLFFYRVLFPLRGMVADARLFHGGSQGASSDGDLDELRTMGNHLRNLMSDVTDTRGRLQRSHDRLAAAEKLASVGKLAASVAHEIRNPLTAIKMWLFSIEETADGDVDLRRKVRIVSEETSRLENIVGSFLEFSRPPVLRRNLQDLRQVIDQTLELLRPRFEQSRVRIDFQSQDALPPVLADAAQLKQVFLNLLSNAADAMPSGGQIRVSLTAETDADGQSMVVVRIVDTGHGMSPDVQRRIFDPFFTTKETGAGLGLSIAAQVMARHGGALVLESSTESGTTFAIWTPIAATNAVAEHGEES
jgi:signal transduction histidine kinase